MNRILTLIIFLITILFGCAELPPMQTQYIIYNNQNYSPTLPEEIKVFAQRLELPKKYIEIGIFKISGTIDKTQLKVLASKKGANAIILEANNCVLIRYKIQEAEESKDEKYKM
jgi:hypothetical protein